MPHNQYNEIIIIYRNIHGMYGMYVTNYVQCIIFEKEVFFTFHSMDVSSVSTFVKLFLEIHG